MEKNERMFESLLEKAEDFGLTSVELVKLRAVDKTAEVVSSIIPYSVAFVLGASFMVFLNLGIAFWLGEILGQFYYGFFLVAAFYVLMVLMFHFFIHKRMKRYICDSIIEQLLK